MMIAGLVPGGTTCVVVAGDGSGHLAEQVPVPTQDPAPTLAAIGAPGRSAPLPPGRG